MTTNQTIDGVPGLRSLIERVTSQELGMSAKKDRAEAAHELRALLDVPAEPKPTGLSHGWNLTRKHDGFVVGHQSVAYPPDRKAIERAERDGYVWVPFLVPAAQPQGEPVAMNRRQFEAWVLGREHPTYGWLDKHWLDRGDNPETYADPYVQGLWAASQALYAEQPAPVAFPGYPPVHEERKLPSPVAVVMPEREPVLERYDDLAEHNLGWNACLDEMERLNTARPAYANPPPGTEPCGTHHDNDGLDDWRKP